MILIAVGVDDTIVGILVMFLHVLELLFLNPKIIYPRCKITDLLLTGKRKGYTRILCRRLTVFVWISVIEAIIMFE